MVAVNAWFHNGSKQEPWAKQFRDTKCNSQCLCYKNTSDGNCGARKKSEKPVPEVLDHEFASKAPKAADSHSSQAVRVVPVLACCTVYTTHKAVFDLKKNIIPSTVFNSFCLFSTCCSQSESLPPSPRQYWRQCDFPEETRTCVWNNINNARRSSLYEITLTMPKGAAVVTKVWFLRDKPQCGISSSAVNAKCSLKKVLSMMIYKMLHISLSLLSLL